MKYKRVFTFYVLFFLGVLTAFGLGYMLRFSQDSNQPDEFPVLSHAHEILKTHAYDDLPEAPALEYGMIRGMIDAYGDPYTRFEAPAQHELSSDALQGSYGGIGASLGYDPEGYTILHPFPDGPAAQAGIQDGDRLIRVDELEIIPGISSDEIIAAIRGPEGERVQIEVLRPPDGEIFTFSIKRQEIPMPSVTWNLEPSENRLGLIHVNLIAASTLDEIQNAVDDLSGRGATHFALDLRGNRGGLLTAGIDIAGLFLSEGSILEEKYRDQDIEAYKVEKPGPLAELPFVILVDADTASAAEIIAGAIQVQDRAAIIGTNTYGKDSIQLIFDLEEGASLHVTAAKWWIPGLEPPIGEGGIQPDIPISTEGGEGDPFIEAAKIYFFGQD